MSRLSRHFLAAPLLAIGFVAEAAAPPAADWCASNPERCKAVIAKAQAARDRESPPAAISVQPGVRPTPVPVDSRLPPPPRPPT